MPLPRSQRLGDPALERCCCPAWPTTARSSRNGHVVAAFRRPTSRVRAIADLGPAWAVASAVHGRWSGEQPFQTPCDSDGAPRPAGDDAKTPRVMYDLPTRVQHQVAMATALAAGANAPPIGDGQGRSWDVLGDSTNGSARKTSLLSSTKSTNSGYAINYRVDCLATFNRKGQIILDLRSSSSSRLEGYPQ